MRSGRLRHQVKIQVPVHPDAWSSDESWVDYATVWASIEPLRGTEFFAARQTNAEVSGKVVMRYLAGVKPDMRILHGSRTFEIVSVVDVEERHRELQIMVNERVV